MFPMEEEDETEVFFKGDDPARDISFKVGFYFLELEILYNLVCPYVCMLESTLVCIIGDIAVFSNFPSQLSLTY